MLRVQTVTANVFSRRVQNCLCRCVDSSSECVYKTWHWKLISRYPSVCASKVQKCLQQRLWRDVSLKMLWDVANSRRKFSKWQQETDGNLVSILLSLFSEFITFLEARFLNSLHFTIVAPVLLPFENLCGCRRMCTLLFRVLKQWFLKTFPSRSCQTQLWIRVYCDTSHLLMRSGSSLLKCVSHLTCTI